MENREQQVMPFKKKMNNYNTQKKIKNSELLSTRMGKQKKKSQNKQDKETLLSNK